jgi:hypothetical protein
MEVASTPLSGGTVGEKMRQRGRSKRQRRQVEQRSRIKEVSAISCRRIDRF